VPVAIKSCCICGSAIHDRHLYCLDKRNGQLLWKFATQGPIEAGTAVCDDSVYVASCDGTLYRVDTRTGKRLWEFHTTPARRGATAIYSSPAIIGDTVCFAAAEGQIYAVDLGTGQLKWKTRDDKHSDMHSSLAFDGRRLYIQTIGVQGYGQNGIAAFGEEK
jgi:outer membrane protein assembly factor BamB